MLSIEDLKQNIDFTKKIFVGFSGGSDSSALLHLLSKTALKHKLDLNAIHINHNLSKNCDDWAEHCKNMCNNLNVNLITETVKIESSGGGPESAARKARYKIFEKYIDINDQLLTAHHSDDITETIFLRLMRGTGIEGLQGLSVSRKFGEGKLIRPLLECSKKDIIKYIEDNKIQHICDDSNDNNLIDRNFLRNEIFPKLDKRWNNFSLRISKTSKIISNRNKNFSKLLNNNYKDLISDSIEKKVLSDLDDEIIKEILRYVIKDKGIAMPSSKVLDEVLKTFINSNPSQKSIVTWSRADKEDQPGKITYRDGKILISANKIKEK